MFETMIVHIKALHLHQIFIEAYVFTTIIKSTQKQRELRNDSNGTTCNMTKMSHVDRAQDDTIASANLSDQTQLVRFLLLPSLL